MRKLFFPILIMVVLAGVDRVHCCTVFLAENGEAVLAGNNEDWSDPNTLIWFEPAEEGAYGAVYVGFGQQFPQGGMNDQGLFFDGLATAPQPQTQSAGKPVFQGNLALRAMRECATVEEVLALFDRYHVRELNNAMLFFGDRSGGAAIIEGDDVVRKGEGERYLLVTNFYRSKVKSEDIPVGRFRIADGMLSGLAALNLEACRDVLSAVHQEGKYPTQYSTVYELTRGAVHIYHFHDFTRSVELNLARELARGPHALEIKSLFPPVFAYEQFVENQVPPISSVLMATISEKGFDAALQQYAELNREHAGDYDFSEPQLNTLGYMLLGGGHVDQAIRIFTLNTEAYPGSWNVWDSLGEAWLKKGDTVAAKRYYRMSLELNPENTNAADILESLAPETPPIQESQ